MWGVECRKHFRLACRCYIHVFRVSNSDLLFSHGRPSNQLQSSCFIYLASGQDPVVLSCTDSPTVYSYATAERRVDEFITEQDHSAATRQRRRVFHFRFRCGPTSGCRHTGCISLLLVGFHAARRSKQKHCQTFLRHIGVGCDGTGGMGRGLSLIHI